MGYCSPRKHTICLQQSGFLFLLLFSYLIQLANTLFNHKYFSTQMNSFSKGNLRRGLILMDVMRCYVRKKKRRRGSLPFRTGHRIAPAEAVVPQVRLGVAFEDLADHSLAVCAQAPPKPVFLSPHDRNGSRAVEVPRKRKNHFRAAIRLNDQPAFLHD